jgi:uncharacterized protein YhhL (DUF1145 family)
MPVRIIHAGGRLGLKAWIVILFSLALGFGLVLAAAIVAIGVFLFLLPVLALAMIASTLMWKWGRRKVPRQPGEPVIIDGEFRLVDEPAPEEPGKLPPAA